MSKQARAPCARAAAAAALPNPRPVPPTAARRPNDELMLQPCLKPNVKLEPEPEPEPEPQEVLREPHSPCIDHRELCLGPHFVQLYLDSFEACPPSGQATVRACAPPE